MTGAMSFIKSTATVAGFTMVSRVTGLLRDQLTAAVLGASGVADAFFVALKLPNLFRLIFAEGAFSASFVPMFSGEMEKNGRDTAMAFAEEALAVMIAVLLPFTAFMLIAMPWAMWLFAPGFGSNPEQVAMAVEMCRVTFPYLMLVSLVSLLGGVLNSFEKFGPFAAAPIAFNLCIIASIWVLRPVTATVGHAMAWGVLISGIVQLWWMWHALKKAGLRLKLIQPHFTARVKRLLLLIGPGCIGAGVIQIDLFLDTVMASLLPKGAISYIYYADRLHQLPLGVIGIAIGTSLLPLLSRQIAANNTESTRHYFSRGLEFGLLLSLPCALALATIGRPILSTLFQHGHFSAVDTRQTLSALIAFSLGIPAFVMGKVMTVNFFARQDTKTPVKVAVIVSAINVGTSLMLMPFFAHGGIAAGTGIGGWAQVLLLRHHLKKRDLWHIDDQFRKRAPRLVASALAMAIVLVALSLAIEHFLPGIWDGRFLTRLLALTALVATGGIVYFLMTEALGATSIADIRTNLRKARTKPKEQAS